MWEACSNMEKYVQYGFHSQRDAVFGNYDNNGNKWNSLVSCEQLYNVLKPLMAQVLKWETQMPKEG